MTMTLFLAFKLLSLIVAPIAFVIWLKRSPRIALACRRFLDSGVWQTARPLAVLAVLTPLPILLMWSNWGVEFQRGDLVYLAAAGSVTVAMLTTWVLAHGATAFERPRLGVLFGLALLCVLAWFVNDLASSRIGHAK